MQFEIHIYFENLINILKIIRLGIYKTKLNLKTNATTDN